MRVISGKFGSRNLKSVPSNKTRPTTDKVKESLFNMIGPYFNGGNFLDLFAGSGAVAIEAVSRGFDKATLVDKQYAAIKTINENVNITKQNQSFNILKMNAENALQSLSNQNEKFDIIFLDPPYKDQKMIKQLQEIYELKLLNENGIVICETDDNVSLSDNVNHYRLSQQKKYGITIISIYNLQG
ncbi:16S rRNA (guanine(966)-N(2))-methyltransferase RsmD [Apilactobacillus timberlakei]|uniref:16S rRNA (Guanine(966)-N(2))-methyltransferase RsmD n=1 Tax=Apilactobacillus timberlakei TaxID=2008380 RepID=A0ABY2YXJ7_9LACO|nr:16S rRNA (guanine(966)-N(2))-methyltransferase RsmD [Apilactobacillus timberlakei]TPR13790.1 16S rRNA (guanine(966)-N(2))-methyltransferase RsmD [Apilactobacillus timberlakei]TPR15105.1 16S rRNA (guanine(966)-N(2))-methyltransferase RsmD [Apilactobacillus timberlakei]TPR16997.1 16S rRNA (guanine(966)-N(2))-methyltransferase RsmD [Apilactobacillus timberlakei]TPR17400.1 16S rRNA (guanine(966)-N(2))-methyltransferase RsmD [Apilactobacillus timberlakei]